MNKKTLVLSVVLLFLSGCALNSNSPEISGPVSSTGLPKAESEVGRTIHQQILQLVPVSNQPIVAEYVNIVGSNLSAFAGRKNVGYQFILLQDDRVYAFNAPGGYVYLTTGAFRLLTNEQELAALLAAEIGALQYRDPRLSRTKKVLQYLLNGGAMIAPAFPPYGSFATIGFAYLSKRIASVMTAENRMYAADRRAIEYLMEAGYDPSVIIGLFERLIDEKNPSHPYVYDYLQSHPITTERLNRISRTFEVLHVEKSQFMPDSTMFMEITQPIRSTFSPLTQSQSQTVQPSKINFH